MNVRRERRQRCEQVRSRVPEMLGQCLIKAFDTVVVGVLPGFDLPAARDVGRRHIRGLRTPRGRADQRKCGKPEQGGGLSSLGSQAIIGGRYCPIDMP